MFRRERNARVTKTARASAHFSRRRVKLEGRKPGWLQRSRTFRDAAFAREAPRRIRRSRTIVLAVIASDIRKRPVRFHERNGFAYNDREIGYQARMRARAPDGHVEQAGDFGDDKAPLRLTATKIDVPPAGYRGPLRSANSAIGAKEESCRLRPRSNPSNV